MQFGPVQNYEFWGLLLNLLEGIRLTTQQADGLDFML
jgi:hypothetical protein